MKKGLKALILGGLASLVLFAVIYASPIVAQAATETIPIYFEYTEDVIGAATVYYDESEMEWCGGGSGIGGYWLDDPSDPVVLVEYYAYGESVSSIYASFSLTLAGVTYSGNVELTPTEGYEVPCYSGYCHLAKEDSSATGYYKQINDLKDLISRISNDPTLTGDARVIEFNVGTALPKDVIKALANSTGVTLKFTFVYEGFEFCVTITSEDAKRIYDPEIDWYGPCFLAQNCPTVWTGKTVA